MNRPDKLWLLLCPAFFFFFIGLGGYDLSAPDEPHYALVAREMVQDNHWILPHRNGQAYPDKPPLFFWSIAGFSLLLGEINPLAARLPSALAATLILYLMVSFSLEFGGRRRALIVGLVLLSSVKFLYQARMAQIDMLLTLCTTWALLGGFRWFLGQGKRQMGFGLALGFGILAKGPVGYLVPVGVWLAFAALNGRTAWARFPRRALLWGLVPPLLWILALFIQVAIADQWDYLQNLLFKQTLVRYFNPWHHHQPFYYFIPELAYGIMPWTAFLVVGAWWARKTDKSKAERFALCALLFTLLFFSISKGKRNLYILPLYPFASYLIGFAIERLLEERARLARVLFALSSLMPLILGVALLAVGMSWFVPKPLATLPQPAPLTAIAVFGGLGALAAFIALVASLRSRFKLSFAATLASLMFPVVLTFTMIMPWISPQRSARPFAEEMNRIIATVDPNPVVAMVQFRAAYRLYGNYPLVELATDYGDPKPTLPTVHQFWEENPNGWVIIRKPHLEELRESLAYYPVLVYSRLIGGDTEFILMRRGDKKQP